MSGPKDLPKSPKRTITHSDSFRRIKPKQPKVRGAPTPVLVAATAMTTREARTLADATMSMQPQKITLTPFRATELLEHNSLNRPTSDQHVHRIARQITEGKWKFNGDTIKVSITGDVLDGQHRLWAIIEAQKAVDTVIVYGIEKEAFATIDTVRRLRSGGDTIALSGQARYRGQIAGALGWYLRWTRNVLETYRAPINRIENSDIEQGFKDYPGIERAVTRAMKTRLIANPSIVAFCYYAMLSQNDLIAEQFMEILSDPAGIKVSHPFFMLRAWFLTDKQKAKDPLEAIALTFKTANLVGEGRETKHLVWRHQGQSPEPFPKLSISWDKVAPSRAKKEG